MVVYEHLNYRQALKEVLQVWKRQRSNATLQKLAERCQIQPPYLTNVLNERSHLNADQLCAVCDGIGLSEAENEYLNLLLQWERATHPKRREKLRAQVDQVRKNSLKSETHLKTPKVELSDLSLLKYYIEPNLQLVYALMGISKYNQNPGALAQALHLSETQVFEILKELESLGLLKKESGLWHKVFPRLHLSKESPLCEPQQTLMRYKSVQFQQALPVAQKYNFQVTFTADEKTRERIQQEFLEFLARIEKSVFEAPSEEAYQMNFDLFSWSQTKS